MQGKGFEFAVVSEILLRGFNCAPATVDAGVDIFVLGKSGAQVKIQVKGRNFKGHGTGVESYNFSKKSYDDPSTRPDFIVMIIRNLINGLDKNPINSILILPSRVFNELKEERYVSDRGKNSNWIFGQSSELMGELQRSSCKRAMERNDPVKI